jgi:nucleotide-binding universal stress UspA family protein
MSYLVATDGSTQGDDAVRYAAGHAAAFDETLEIAHVLTPDSELVDGTIILPGEDAAVEAGEGVLSSAASIAAEAVAGDAPDVETQLLTGRPADAITEYAAEAGVEAIYVGHRGLSEEREQVVGSVAKSVVDKAQVPVTVIR